jgi:hypothetical protein
MAVITDGFCNGRCLYRMGAHDERRLQRMVVTADGSYNGWWLQRTAVTTDFFYNKRRLKRMVVIAGGCFNGWRL